MILILRRHLYYITFILFGGLFYYKPLIELAKLSFKSELYSHFLLIPVVSLYFFWIDRKKIFSGSGYSLYVGTPVVIMGLVFYWVAVANVKDLSQNDFLSLSTLGFVAWLNGGFIGFYGTLAFRKAIFPLLFLAFMIPIPTLILDPLIRILVAASAETSYAVLTMFGVPIYRNGYVFELSGDCH